MLIDIFTYTQASPNAPFDLESLMEAARCARLDGIAVTDRGTSSRAREYADKAARAGFFVAFGVEIETASGRVVAYPAHIDDEFVSEGWRSLGERPDASDVLSYFHDRGGVVVARDVFNRGEGLRDAIYAAKDAQGRGVDAVDTVAVYRRRIDNELSIEAQQVLGVPACAGSGVFDSLQDIGHCATLFAGDIRDQESFVAELRGPLHWACALRDLGDACPMGAAPVEDRAERGDRGFERRGRGEGRRGEERRGDDRREARGRDRRHGDDRRGGGDRRGGDRRGGDRRGGRPRR